MSILDTVAWEKPAFSAISLIVALEIQQLNVFSNEFIMFESVIAINVGNFVFNENGLATMYWTVR